jgi:hypothetical protein
VTTLPGVASPSAPASAPASTQLTLYPTSSEHPDFVTGAIFVVLSALLLGVAFAVRVLRRRLRRT